jgi:hypothetical protein
MLFWPPWEAAAQLPRYDVSAKKDIMQIYRAAIKS